MRWFVVAYIDPGSGALIWQTLLASVLGAGYFLRGWIQRMGVRLFKKHDSK